MCGIAGFHVKDPGLIKKHQGVELLVDELLKGIEHRGKHATGFVSVGFDGKVVIDKAPKEATEFIKDREKIPEGVRTVLLHTRYATKGSKEQHQNNHPVIYGSCFAVHNGHIDNDDELFEEFDLKRGAEVDSEVIAACSYFNGIGNIDDIKVTLEKLQGPMATAIINPIQNPGRVVLAKGAQSPLYVVDTPKFLVWASTEKTILDAWGKVLGTPPKAKKVDNINEGSIIVVDDTEVSRDRFTVKRRPFVQSKPVQSPTTKPTGNSGRNPLGFRAPAPKEIGEDNAVAKAREAIAEFIKAGGTARNFDNHQLGLYDDDEFKDVDGDRKWHPCYGCQRLILEQDMQKTLNWGTICVDCHTATTRAIAKSSAEMQDEEYVEYETCAGTPIPRIPEVDRDSLEIWADHEMTLHRDTLEEISKATGSFYSPEVINFLCFLTTPEYRESVGSSVSNLIDELRDYYEEVATDLLAQEHEDVIEHVKAKHHIEGARGSEDTDWPIRPEAIHPLLLEAGENWGFCYDHNVSYPVSEGDCAICLDEIALADEARNAAVRDDGVVVGEVIEEHDEGVADTGDSCGVVLPFERGRDTVVTRSERSYTRSSGKPAEGEGGDGEGLGEAEVIDLDQPKCPNCKSFVLSRSNRTCLVCRESSTDDTAHEGTDRPACSTCGGDPSEVKFIVSYAGKNYYYCQSCYTECGKLVQNEDQSLSLCHTKSNHMLSTGMRVCHIHVRGQGGALSDTTLRKRGATITEVV